MTLETDRLKIVPLTAGQFRMLLDDPSALTLTLGLARPPVPMDSETRLAMEDLFNCAVADSVNWPWNTNWQIILRSANIPVGSACFLRDPGIPDTVETGYGIDEEHRNKGYMTEALGALCGWAFAQPGIIVLQAQTAEDNRASQKVLRNVGMVLKGPSVEGLLWHITKIRFYELKQRSNEDNIGPGNTGT